MLQHGRCFTVSTFLLVVSLVASGCQGNDRLVGRSDIEQISYLPESDLNTIAEAGPLSLRPVAGPSALQYVPGTTCKQKSIGGRTRKCCRSCSHCLVKKDKCLNGKGPCRCEASDKKEKYAAYHKLVQKLKKKVCHKPVKTCKKVQTTVPKQCKKCKDVGVKKYNCGKTCKRIPRIQNGPLKNVTVDCMIPGKPIVVANVTKTCSIPSSGKKCQYVKYPKKVECGKVSYKTCTTIPVKEPICVKVKTPTKKCTALLQPDGQSCKEVHGGKVSCKKVPDGYTKHCELVQNTKQHCSVQYNKEAYNCRKVKMEKRGACTKHFETKQVCSRVAITEKCKDVVKTKRKCFLMLAYKKACPTMKKKVCKELPHRVKLPGSCKKANLPCLSYSLRTPVSRGSAPAFEKYNDCRTMGVVCKHKTVMVPSCMLKDVPIPGRRCAEIPHYEKKCKDIKSKARECYPVPAVVAATQVSPDRIPMESFTATGGGKCAKSGQKCAGATGHPFFQHVPCCNKNEECVHDKSKGWGKFCATKKSEPYTNLATKVRWNKPEPETCAKDGDRCAGAVGHPYFKYRACCSSSSTCKEDSKMGWGKFCINGSSSSKGTSSGNLSCKYVKVPVTKCKNDVSYEDKCDYRKVPKKHCTSLNAPTAKCHNVPKYRQDCSATPGKVVCKDKFREETKCTKAYTTSKVCKKVTIHKSVCSKRFVHQCKSSGDKKHKICVNISGGKPKCTVKRTVKKYKTKPMKGKCTAMVPGPSTVTYETKCQEKVCTKPVRKCEDTSCPQKSYKKKCKIIKKPCACPIPKPPVCKKPKYCTRVRRQCRTKSCSKPKCSYI